jgi:hypothetical protein
MRKFLLPIAFQYIVRRANFFFSKCQEIFNFETLNEKGKIVPRSPRRQWFIIEPFLFGFSIGSKTNFFRLDFVDMYCIFMPTIQNFYLNCEQTFHANKVIKKNCCNFMKPCASAHFNLRWSFNNIKIQCLDSNQ